EVRSDEAGSSGDEISHGAVPPKWRLPCHSAGGGPSIIVSSRAVRRGDVSPLPLLTDDRPHIGVYSRLMRSRPRKHSTGPVAAAVVLSALLALLLGAPGTAAGSPDTATPAPGSPAGTEYGLPFDQGRGAGGGGSHTGSGGPFPSGGGGGGGGGGASGTGGTGGTGSA